MLCDCCLLGLRPVRPYQPYLPHVWVVEVYFSLNLSDVDYNAAASASCVRPVMFKKILGTVQDFMGIEPLKSRTEEYDGDVATYAELMQVFRPQAPTAPLGIVWVVRERRSYVTWQRGIAWPGFDGGQEREAPQMRGVCLGL